MLLMLLKPIALFALKRAVKSTKTTIDDDIYNAVVNGLKNRPYGMTTIEEAVKYADQRAVGIVEGMKALYEKEEEQQNNKPKKATTKAKKSPKKA